MWMMLVLFLTAKLKNCVKILIIINSAHFVTVLSTYIRDNFIVSRGHSLSVLINFGDIQTKLMS